MVEALIVFCADGFLHSPSRLPAGCYICFAGNIHDFPASSLPIADRYAERLRQRA
ncbi:hypothetical protein BSIN_3939 [Burkholderia singularis]|uniref:Uncharacterized protein n=1 Tax=Burkholderia singularis TaxID=1503053 RepID=A0A238H6J6_9BURK|nr:hypothetical protein BSIN_3939 [Burkholderia singularis]